MSVPPADDSRPLPRMADERRKKFNYYSQLYVIPAVDAVDAGKGQLEISVNQGRVPNNVQMQGAGRCLVTFIPQHPGTYVIDVTFNGEQVHGAFVFSRSRFLKYHVVVETFCNFLYCN
ncbi:Filamin/ABP280 repeat protein [Oesophagostomum dentatum]|uniref:Filamin/ABP280 repeat protein n=1 Tax=Oesophagostomum dentatum TaxID=61180 RepID=A0A0B1SVS4_OESDE|nr:Filamin/ABP280 repeat protein [Oesophagostomum dentatum]